MKLKQRVKLFKKYFKKNKGKANLTVHNLIEEDYDYAVERAKKLLAIDETETISGPIIITIPSNFYEGIPLRYRYDKISKDETKLVYDQSVLTVLLFGEKTLYYYQGDIDHQNGYVGEDVAGQVDYFDIVNLQTSLETNQDLNPNVSELFVQLGLSDGSSLTLKLRHRHLVEGNLKEEVLTEQEETIIKTLRQIVNKSR